MITYGEFLPCDHDLKKRSTMLLVLAISTIVAKEKGKSKTNALTSWSFWAKYGEISRVIFWLCQKYFESVWSWLKPQSISKIVRRSWKLREHWPDMLQLICAKLKKLKSETVTKLGDLLFIKTLQHLMRYSWSMSLTTKDALLLVIYSYSSRLALLWWKQKLLSPDREHDNSLLCCERLLSTYVARVTR